MSQRLDRADVLDKIRPLVGGSHESQKIQSRVVFCPDCAENITIGNDKPGQKKIKCKFCDYEGDRALIFDQRVM